jgi:hypothetical protein
MHRQHLACLPYRLASCGDFSPNSLSSLALRPDDFTRPTAFRPGRSKGPTLASNAKPTAFAMPNSSNSRFTARKEPATNYRRSPEESHGSTLKNSRDKRDYLLTH